MFLLLLIFLFMHLKETGRRVSSWFRLTTEAVMRRLAKEAGAVFNLLHYDEDTGSAVYTFNCKA